MAGSFREGERGSKERGGRRKQEGEVEDGADPRGREELQVAGVSWQGKSMGALPDLGVRLINTLTEFSVL